MYSEDEMLNGQVYWLVYLLNRNIATAGTEAAAAIGKAMTPARSRCFRTLPPIL